jgi:hypothetical protein
MGKKTDLLSSRVWDEDMSGIDRTAGREVVVDNSFLGWGKENWPVFVVWLVIAFIFNLLLYFTNIP